MLSAACLVATAVGASVVSGGPAIAVYALGFWHYLLYWWAFKYGVVTPARFRRDAVVMKSVAMVGLAVAYLGAPVHRVSAAIVALGFVLNGLAAAALGPVRTYYGWELGAVSYQQVTRFPYSLVRHPMLVGNLVAHAGMLLNPTFRRDWWPLAAGHLLLNGGLLLMEAEVTPERRGSASSGQARGLLATIAIAVPVGGTVGLIATAAGWWTGAVPIAAVAAAAAVYIRTNVPWYVGPPRAVATPLSSSSREAI